MLQDVGLIFHPPLLYMGYVGFSVAFAFAIVIIDEWQIRYRLGKMVSSMDNGWHGFS